MAKVQINVIPPAANHRFTRTNQDFIEYYQNILDEFRHANPIIPDPCTTSKLNAALEFVLVKSGCEIEYNLVDDNGWPVFKTYAEVPLPYSYNNQKFTVLILADPDIRYLIFNFGVESYVVFGCVDNSIPWIDDNREFNCKRVLILSDQLHDYLFAALPVNRPCPILPFYEKYFIHTNVFPPDDLVLANVRRSSQYLRLGIVEVNLNIQNKIFRMMMFALRENGCIAEGADPPPNLVNYTGQVVRMRYDGNTCFVSLIEGGNFFLFAIKDENRKLILIHRIPFGRIPEFGILPAIIAEDNNKIRSLVKFVKSILMKSSKIVKARIARSRSRRTSISNDSFNEHVAQVRDPQSDSD